MENAQRGGRPVLQQPSASSARMFPQAYRPMRMIRGGWTTWPVCSTASSTSAPRRPLIVTPPPTPSSSRASSPVPFPLGPFCPGPRPGPRRDREAASSPIWSWQCVGQGLDLGRQPPREDPGPQSQPQRLPSFGVRTAAASMSMSESSEMAGSSGSAGSAGSLASAAVSSSPPSPPHTLPRAELTDSSDFDEFPALMSLARLQLESCNSVMMQPAAPTSPQQSNSAQTKRGQPRRSGIFCAFCRGNGELPRIFLSHTLHTQLPDGTMIVSCDVLRSLRCELCGASGDFAHTRSHCPYNRQPSVAVLLKNTPRRCDGTLRKKK